MFFPRVKRLISKKIHLPTRNTFNHLFLRHLIAVLINMNHRQILVSEGNTDKFTSVAMFRFSLTAHQCHALCLSDLTIYAANGKMVKTLVLGYQDAGFIKAAYWDGRNEIGKPVASDIYFYTLTAGKFTATRKMLIRK